MVDNDRAGRDPAPAVTRSIRLLGLLAESRSLLTLTELATSLGIAKSSTANLCLALEASGMVERAPSGYRLGRKAAELGGAYAAQFNQVREFYGVCSSSSVLVEEVVQVAMLDGSDALYLARHEGSRLMRFGTPLGSRLPAALTAAGRALLSRLGDDQVTELLAGAEPFPEVSGRGTRTLKELLAVLGTTRERGWSLDEGESFDGVVGVAVPLEGWAPSDPDLAIGVAIPAVEATRERIDRVAAALLEAARALTNPFSEAARR
jgi:DNA-binding IclR family transcriptional regulator